jgi:hypothetical protein
MKELTFEEFCNLPLMSNLGFQTDAGALRIWRNKAAGLTIEAFTPRKRKGDIYSGWKKSTRRYYLDGNAKCFETPDQVYVAYMEKVCGIGESK